MTGIAAFLADASSQISSGASAACSGGACGSGNINTIFGSIANVLIFIVGAVAVIMIIIAGLRYVSSNGDSKQIEAAKNTLLYAVIGLVVAIISFAVVNFVVTHIK